MPAAVDREVIAPVILDAFVRHRAPGLEAVERVGTAAERRFQCGSLELVVGEIGLREHRHLAQDLRELAVLAVLESELHAVLVALLDLGDVAVVDAVERPAFLAQRVEGPEHVVRRDRRTIVEPRLRPQVIDHPGTVLRHLHGFRDEAIGRLRLVLGAHGESVEQQSGARRRHALEDERIERIEAGADREIAHRAALGRTGIHILEMREVRRIFDVAVERERV